MIDAVVYIGHGSRRDEGNAQFKRFIESVMKETSYSNQEIAFLELTHPTIAETLEKLIEQGAKRFLIVPVLLFSALHHKLDIPEELEAVQKKYPFISFKMSEPFGVHSYMIQLVVKRIQATMTETSAAILLIGRGSSDLGPIQGLQQIGRTVEQKLGMPVYESFLTAGKPSMKEAMAFLSHRYKKVYVMPYLLFTGLLLEKINKAVIANAGIFELCQNLEFDERMRKVLVERMEEACHEEDVPGYDESGWKNSSHCRRGENSSA